jgi:hypothetical protein
MPIWIAASRMWSQRAVTVSGQVAKDRLAAVQTACTITKVMA